jgi:transporter family-2 protein
MGQTILTILIGLLGGVCVGVQSPLAGKISEKVGGAASSLVVHLSGTVLSLVLLMIRGGEQIRNWRSLTWYMLASGAFGLILYLTLSHTLPRLGAAAAVSLIIVGQLIGGLVIDQFGLFGVPIQSITPERMLAMVLLIAGGVLMTK